MLFVILWGLAILYAVASALRVIDYHQVASLVALLSLGLFEVTRRQESAVRQILWSIPTLLSAIAFLYLSPAQVKLLGHLPGQNRYPDTYEPKNGKPTVE